MEAQCTMGRLRRAPGGRPLGMYAFGGIFATFSTFRHSGFIAILFDFGLLPHTCRELWANGCTGAQAISDCYELDLIADPLAELDPHFPSSSRQRIEFRSPTDAAGMPYVADT
jgi:hypothetical protein